MNINQISLDTIINELLAFGTGHTVIQTSTFGDIRTNVSGGNTAYPLFNLDLIGGTYNENRIIYNFRAHSVDKKIHDSSNIISKYSSTSDFLAQFVVFVDKANRFKNRIKLESISNFTTFPFDLLDGVCGHELNFSVSIQNETKLCNIDIQGGVS